MQNHCFYYGRVYLTESRVQVVRLVWLVTVIFWIHRNLAAWSPHMCLYVGTVNSHQESRVLSTTIETLGLDLSENLLLLQNVCKRLKINNSEKECTGHKKNMK